MVDMPNGLRLSQLAQKCNLVSLCRSKGVDYKKMAALASERNLHVDLFLSNTSSPPLQPQPTYAHAQSGGFQNSGSHSHHDAGKSRSHQVDSRAKRDTGGTGHPGPSGMSRPTASRVTDEIVAKWGGLRVCAGDAEMKYPLSEVAAWLGQAVIKTIDRTEEDLAKSAGLLNRFTGPQNYKESFHGTTSHCQTYIEEYEGEEEETGISEHAMGAMAPATETSEHTEHQAEEKASMAAQESTMRPPFVHAHASPSELGSVVAEAVEITAIGEIERFVQGGGFRQEAQSMYKVQMNVTITVLSTDLNQINKLSHQPTPLKELKDLLKWN